MEETIRRRLPNGPDQAFSLSELISYTKDIKVASYHYSSLSSSECKDFILVEMLATAFNANKFNDLFINLCTSFKNSKVILVHHALFLLEKCIRGEGNDNDIRDADENIRKALTIDYKFFLVWLARCILEMFRKNFKQASEFFEAANRIFNDQDHDDESLALKSLYRFTPLLKMMEGFLNYSKEKYQNAYKDFMETTKVSIRAVPMIRLGLGLCKEKQDKKTQAKVAYFACLKHELDLLRSNKCKELRDYLSSSEEISPEEREEKETEIARWDTDYQPNSNIIAELEQTRELHKDIKNTSVLLHLAMLDQSNIQVYSSVMDESDPNNIAFQLYKTHLRFRLKQYMVIIHSLAKKKDNTPGLIKYIPEDKKELKAECLFQIARVNHARNKIPMENIIKMYEQVIENSESHFPAHFALAHLYLCLGQVDKCIGHLKPYITNLHNKYEAFMILGMAYSKKFSSTGDKDYANEGKTALTEAIRLIQQQDGNKELHKLHCTLGWLCLKTLEYEKAGRHFDETCKILSNAGQEPDDQTLTYLAISQFMLEKYAESLSTYRRVINQDGPIIKFNIARCHEELGDNFLAIEIYKKLVSDYPTFPEPYLRLGVINMQERNYTAAKENFQTVIQECRTQTVRANLYLAMVYNIEGMYRNSTAITEKIRQQNPPVDGRLTASIMYANGFLMHGQKKERLQEREKYFSHARGFFYSALKLNHHCIPAASGLAITWLLLGMENQARSYLRIVKENLPRLPGPAETLANAYLRGAQINSRSSESSNAMQAALEFEECNRNHYDCTNTRIFLGAYNAYKINAQNEQCLIMAEYMIQLEPDRPVYWYYLASSIFKNIQTKTSGHTIDMSKTRVKDIDIFIAQANRSIFLFEKFDANSNKIGNIKDRLIPKLKRLREEAKRNEELRIHRQSKAVPEAIITEDNYKRY